MVIVNLPCECGREEWRWLEIRRGREDDLGDHAVDIIHFFTCPCPVVKRVIKDVMTGKSLGGANFGTFPFWRHQRYSEIHVLLTRLHVVIPRRLLPSVSLALLKSFSQCFGLVYYLKSLGST